MGIVQWVNYAVTKWNLASETENQSIKRMDIVQEGNKSSSRIQGLMDFGTHGLKSLGAHGLRSSGTHEVTNSLFFNKYLITVSAAYKPNKPGI